MSAHHPTVAADAAELLSLHSNLKTARDAIASALPLIGLIHDRRREAGDELDAAHCILLRLFSYTDFMAAQWREANPMPEA
jgi:hypothetical protein